jgi:hypothetical protein
VTDARSKLPELIDTQVRDGGVVYPTRYGQRVGAVVPAEVTERFEHWEDIYGSRRAAEILNRNESTVLWEEAARLATAQQTRTQHSVHHSVST